MQSLNDFARSEVDLGKLYQLITQTGGPVHINVLARGAIWNWLEKEIGSRPYAPGERFKIGDKILYSGQEAQVSSVQSASNPKQGSFDVLELRLADGATMFLAANVLNARRDQRLADDSNQETARLLSGDHGPQLRQVVREALQQDGRFRRFADAQGERWCTADLLPVVSDQHILAAVQLMNGLLIGGLLRPRPTQDLVSAIWNVVYDGNRAYELHAFALDSALSEYYEVRWLGTGWALEADWQRLQERPELVGPRQPNQITLPAGVQLDESGHENSPREARDGERPPASPQASDLDAWLVQRRPEASFILRAPHYYGDWLPLSPDLRRIFPPLDSGAYGVSFYYNFGGITGTFQAWVDLESARILGEPAMYEALRANGIYPGAHLIVSHRGDYWTYDLRTQPAKPQQSVKIRRVSLDADGQLRYEEFDEPLRYEVGTDVFVADSRWEDLPALFRQAELVGAGIFQLMYEKCSEWWEAGDRQALNVNIRQLFEAIHFGENSRLTSQATIAWELWRRASFEPVGSGTYRFRPEKGDQFRQAVTLSRTSPESSQSKRTRPLQKSIRGIRRGATDTNAYTESGLRTDVRRLIGAKLHTLDEDKGFQILEVRENEILVHLDTSDNIRSIHWGEFQASWDHLMREGKLSRSFLQSRYSAVNPAYVAAILASLPGITHTLKPIILNRKRIATSADAEALNADVFYALGLIAGRGSFAHSMPQQPVVPQPALRIHLQSSASEADSVGSTSADMDASWSLLQERLSSRFGNVVTFERSSSALEIIVRGDSQLFRLARQLVHPSGSMTVSPAVLQAPRPLQIEFARGLADAAGFVRSKQAYIDGRVFIFFQIRHSDWMLPTQFCRLLQLGLGVPVSFIIWGHPNIREPGGKGNKVTWAKEHQLKVFCDAFEDIGFFLPHKRQALEPLVAINKAIGKPIPALCHPNNKRVREVKPAHPHENLDLLPAAMRGEHFDAWWQVCLKMGCPFAAEYVDQPRLIP